MNEPHYEVAVFGGGCFWCTEAVLAGLKGVKQVEPGYTGGHVQNPTYEQICNQDTGHIEVVRVQFDPQVIGYDDLLDVFFGTHDPTTLNRQGADVGPQYASVIFYQSPEQEIAAQAAIGCVQQALGKPVVTRLLPAEHFWPAETYHYQYYQRNPGQGYCQFVIAPKMAALRKKFASLLA
ncbi:peptide-methionine (S)-S-oxide reductase MsrA [Pusillimonas sp. CC-YST705]|uniref:Peptide methionine sulfoxide reductase MsrA n=1 Tax=Mesopusillimonas faecipullorum TaxID=2755040 RepID=A0ABS8CBI5_9BURK|nr:peptide-methionine (S)-S-oxide reductase MsrA [Mesopusillimonas faecipullorum]MCB5363383.1 peptide-methionine (S)-S-oxide reductase MsrA [Mesopusillimonas faecipullorum]